ncbi:hypothetical protein NPIL_17851 [Nephila pilipes]|uniref:Uncharacterized protein n=1 Tax=Nephila pilipes TaxID=299642 RepID=A0A8X6NXS6_NEPPI|nr:hypothetical protein NPIL_17851 [Nephila pilipes]
MPQSTLKIYQHMLEDWTECSYNINVDVRESGRWKKVVTYCRISMALNLRPLTCYTIFAPKVPVEKSQNSGLSDDAKCMGLRSEPVPKSIKDRISLSECWSLVKQCKL